MTRSLSNAFGILSFMRALSVEWQPYLVFRHTVIDFPPLKFSPRMKSKVPPQWHLYNVLCSKCQELNLKDTLIVQKAYFTCSLQETLEHITNIQRLTIYRKMLWLPSNEDAASNIGTEGRSVVHDAEAESRLAQWKQLWEISQVAHIWICSIMYYIWC